jgi:protease-4
VVLDACGLSAIARQVEMTQAIDRFGLDGMLALWHPAQIR